MQRKYQHFIEQDLEKAMVFIGGPRQVGKTTLCKSIGKAIGSYQYLNWDIAQDRKIILEQSWLQSCELIIFDEIHKYPKWKQWIKGVYDGNNNKQKILVTGSARLDIYKRGGDSLLGRYHYWRLHPFSLQELPENMDTETATERLLEYGGFPQPFLYFDSREARRWRLERFNRVVKEDIRDLQFIKEIQSLTLFIDALKDRAGQLITLSNIAQDLAISPSTAKSWLKIAESMYLAFAIYPLTNKVPRSIQKPPKVYFFDNADIVNNTGARLENLVATHLLKYLHFIEDYHGYSCNLHYIRDKDGREVDFVTIIDGKVHSLIEVKSSSNNISTSLRYYQKLLQPQNTIQIIGKLRNSYIDKDVLVTNPGNFFANDFWNKEPE